MKNRIAIFASWPNGVWLSQKLCEVDRDVCYVDTGGMMHRPMGVFLSDLHGGEKRFLESLGSLERQEGGFCLLSNGRPRHFQEPCLSFSREEEHVLPFFDFTAPVFESNRQTFSPPSDLSLDYFLFFPHLSKKTRVQSDFPAIRWISKGIQAGEKGLSADGEFFPWDQVIWIGKNSFQILNGLLPAVSPDWEWADFEFQGDLKAYKDIAPSHFVSINHLSFPWTHDNLLSVFHIGETFQVWCRCPFRKRADKAEEEDLILGIKKHLQKIFPKMEFPFLRKRAGQGLFVYGAGAFSRLEGDLVLRGGFISQLRCERRIFQRVSAG